MDRKRRKCSEKQKHNETTCAHTAQCDTKSVIAANKIQWFRRN